MNVDSNIKLIAQRIRELREILEVSADEMASLTGCSPEEYAAYESGERDFSFTFLHKSAERLGVDITDLLTGQPPRLSTYSVVRKGQGLPIERRKGFSYQSMAYLFKDKAAEPFVVKAPYDEAAADKPIALSTHFGQEFDFVLSGRLRVTVNGHEELLEEGDAIYYNSSHPHGMTAADKEGCTFLAVVIKS